MVKNLFTKIFKIKFKNNAKLTALIRIILSKIMMNMTMIKMVIKAKKIVKMIKKIKIEMKKNKIKQLL